MKPATAEDTTTDEPRSVDAACQKVMTAVADRRENGGAPSQVRIAALKLIEKIFDDLEDDA
jgi:hypothetical protein